MTSSVILSPSPQVFVRKGLSPLELFSRVLLPVDGKQITSLPYVLPWWSVLNGIGPAMLSAQYS